MKAATLRVELERSMGFGSFLRVTVGPKGGPHWSSALDRATLSAPTSVSSLARSTDVAVSSWTIVGDSRTDHPFYTDRDMKRARQRSANVAYYQTQS